MIIVKREKETLKRFEKAILSAADLSEKDVVLGVDAPESCITRSPDDVFHVPGLDGKMYGWNALAIKLYQRYRQLRHVVHFRWSHATLTPTRDENSTCDGRLTANVQKRQIIGIYKARSKFSWACLRTLGADRL